MSEFSIRTGVGVKTDRELREEKNAKEELKKLSEIGKIKRKAKQTFGGDAVQEQKKKMQEFLK